MSTPAAVVDSSWPVPGRLPRVLSSGGEFGPTTLGEHIERFGRPPGLHRRGDRTAFVDVVERSGLRGRGGGAFPTSVKLRAVAQSRRRPIVVANGAEGEPLSAKDKILLATAPHLVLDGAVLAASALRADDVIVVVDRTARDARVAVENAIEERRAARMDPVSLPNGRLAHAVSRRRGERTRPLAQRRPGEADVRPAAPLRAWCRRTGDSRPERRDTRAHGSHRALRRLVVPEHRITFGARFGSRDGLWCSCPSGGARDQPRHAAGHRHPGGGRRDRGDLGISRRWILRHVAARVRWMGSRAQHRGRTCGRRRIRLRGGRGTAGDELRTPRDSWGDCGTWPRRLRVSADRACTGWMRSRMRLHRSRTAASPRGPSNGCAGGSATSRAGAPAITRTEQSVSSPARSMCSPTRSIATNGTAGADSPRGSGCSRFLIRRIESGGGDDAADPCRSDRV